jgi:hypothetical protein
MTACAVSHDGWATSLNPEWQLFNSTLEIIHSTVSYQRKIRKSKYHIAHCINQIQSDKPRHPHRHSSIDANNVRVINIILKIKFLKFE